MAKAAELSLDFAAEKGHAAPHQDTVPQAAPGPAPKPASRAKAKPAAKAKAPKTPKEPAAPASNEGEKPEGGPAQATFLPDVAPATEVVAHGPAVKWLDMQPGAVLPVQPAVQGTRALTIRVQEDLHRSLRLYCAAAGTTVQELGIEGFVLALRARGVAI